MGERIVLRRDADPIDGEPLVKFRLFYQGPLFASKGDAMPGQVDRRGGHKHDIRLAFHKQLKHYWDIHPWLSTSLPAWGITGNAPPDKGASSLFESLAVLHEVSGAHFVPLVCEQFELLCELDILLLRRDRPGGIINARDIDNRLKTVFDALRMPHNGTEMVGAEFHSDEQPCCVLLQDDSLITHVHVETDELLDPPPESGKDDSYVRLLIGVKLHPYNVNTFNLSFA